MTQPDVSTPFALALQALAAETPEAKLTAMGDLEIAISPMTDPVATATSLRYFQAHSELVQPLRGRCQRWVLVSPDKVPRRRPTSASGRAALLHAIAHIEYSAIDLALDHALRFEGMPSDYYADWLRVALDETRHFRMLRDHLVTLGHDYGDFPVHDSLWQMAERTALDVLPRMAMVPRLLEARGLDATPTHSTQA